MTLSCASAISLFPLHHRGRDVLGIAFDYDEDVIRKIKTLPERKYSATHKCWYIPRTREAYRGFYELGLSHVIKHKSASLENVLSGHAQDSLPVRHQSAKGNEDAHSRQSDSVGYREAKPTSDIFSAKVGKIGVQFSRKHFFISTPYDEGVISRIRKLQRVWWNRDLRKWIAYGSYANLQKIQELFNCWTEDQFDQIRMLIGAYENPKRVTFYRLPDKSNRIAVELSGYGVDHQVLLRVSGREYQKVHKRWLIPYDEELVRRLTAYYVERQTEVINRLPSAVKENTPLELSNRDRQARFLKRFKASERPLLTQMSDVMIQQRYSWQSIRSYCGVLVKFSSFIGTTSLHECSMEDIQRFLTHMSKSNVSNSLLNTYVSALKFYYGRVVNRPDVAIEKIRRPRKHRKLPVVLSVEEVSRMIEVTENLKHKTILYCIYSSGLRLGELLNLKLEDIKWERSQLLIRQAKGKKDRMVMLSEVLKNALQLYCREYKPAVYLFESTSPGKPYSPKSVQNVVKKAAKLANINQQVTPHVLRHCFATHLLDSGTNIRLIQELLGHKDIKTTLIYTHVTTEQATAVQSPLDRLQHLDKKRSDDIEKVRL